MKKSICELIFAVVLMVTIPAEFIGVMGMESDVGAWAWWLCIGCAILQLTAMALLKVASRQENRA